MHAGKAATGPPLGNVTRSVDPLIPMWEAPNVCYHWLTKTKNPACGVVWGQKSLSLLSGVFDLLIVYCTKN